MGLFDGKSEAPTAKKREDARKKGQFAKSRDVISVLVLVAGFTALKKAAPQVYGSLRADLVFYLTLALQGDRADALQEAPLKLIAGSMMVLTPLLVAVMVAAVVGNVAQTGPVLIGQPLKFDFTKMNPVKGLQRMVSAPATVELLKASAKVGLVAWVVNGWLRGVYPEIIEMSQMELVPACQFAGSLLSELVAKTVSALVLVAAADYGWQKYQHETQLKMTRQEVVDEMRQSEGSPEIKAAIRRKMRQMMRGRMMAAVPGADVVITNPTHYAVALKYAPQEMDAPTVVALGQRLVALKIRELAEEHGVPIVENPPLARALYAACDVDSQIPSELYAAVAEVLAYVYRLHGRGLPFG